MQGDFDQEAPKLRGYIFIAIWDKRPPIVDRRCTTSPSFLTTCRYVYDVSKSSNNLPVRVPTKTKVAVSFTGTASSQEINGTFAAVACEAAFSAGSVALLGLGSTCQFVSTSTMMVRAHVTAGAAFTSPAFSYGFGVLSEQPLYTRLGQYLHHQFSSSA